MKAMHEMQVEKGCLKVEPLLHVQVIILCLCVQLKQPLPSWQVFAMERSSSLLGPLLHTIAGSMVRHWKTIPDVLAVVDAEEMISPTI